MQKLVECVPNFSEGRDPALIESITAEITAVAVAQLLDVDPGADTNRTVVTFVAPPDAAVEAAFRAIDRASRLIDMRTHRGEHPRMGATDVCPFVPLQGTTMEECAGLARRLGERVGSELGIPVFLYGEAASAPERVSLAEIRAGEYEGMAEKLRRPEWKPDYGPSELPPRAGATAIGAREFLIAYNVNLNTRDKKLAHEVALDIREAGRNLRGADGKLLRDESGAPVKAPGRLRECRAVGWYIAEYGRAQVSINLTDFNVTPVHAAFDACVEEAGKYGLRVTGSELVGLIPLEAIRRAGIHYLERQGKSAGVPERELIHVAVRSLGLDELGPFDPQEKIIEYRVRDRTGSLVEMTAREFADELSTDSPAPGGGSVAALCGSLGAALATMVANLTLGSRKHEASWDQVLPVARAGQGLKDWFLAAVDEDTRAFNAVMTSMRMPKKTDDEVAAREKSIQSATRRATEVPLSVLERSLEVLDLAEVAVRAGNPASVSDAGVAGICARACAEGAFLNVAINLEGITDRAWAQSTLGHARDLLQAVRRRAETLVSAVEAKVAG
jgi:glutamate formiminotransferase/formiminotetrahydrofolate cyclodeaminase